jgi:hypothetical protein
MSSPDLSSECPATSAGNVVLATVETYSDGDDEERNDPLHDSSQQQQRVTPPPTTEAMTTVAPARRPTSLHHGKAVSPILGDCGPLPSPSHQMAPAPIPKSFRSSTVVLNVGGERHRVMWKTLARIPRSRLGRLCRLMRGVDAIIPAAADQPADGGGCSGYTVVPTAKTTSDARPVVRSSVHIEKLLELCDDVSADVFGFGAICDECEPDLDADGGNGKPAFRQFEFFFDRHPRSFMPIVNFYRTGRLHVNEDVCALSFAEDLEYWGIDELQLEPCCQIRYEEKKRRAYDEMRRDAEAMQQMTSVDSEQFGPGRFSHLRMKTWNLLEKPQTSLAARVS